jgi:hypothetical protein
VSGTYLDVRFLDVDVYNLENLAVHLQFMFFPYTCYPKFEPRKNCIFSLALSNLQTFWSKKPDPTGYKNRATSSLDATCINMRAYLHAS